MGTVSSWKKAGSGVAEHLHSGRDMARTSAEVDVGSSLPRLVPAVDIGRADLQLKCRGYPILDLQAVVLRILAVRVQVYEAGRRDKSPGIYLISALEITRSHRL